MSTALTRAVTVLAQCWPSSVGANETLERQLAFLGVPVSSAAVLRAGYTAGVVSAVVVLLVGVGLGLPVAAAGLGSAAVGTLAVHAVHRGPAALAAIERTRALCAASDLVGLLVLRARLTPAVEPAVGFAARTGDGPLARSLDDHIRRAAGTPETGLDTFVTAWRAWFPALERAADLVTTAVDAPESERDDLLDDALAVVVDATRGRMASFAADVRGPATAVYAFGVLLPLALVGILPAAGVAGTSVSLPLLAFGYDVVLPVGLVGASGWLLVRRPVTFVTPSVPRTHPDVRMPWWQPPLAGGVTAGLAWVLVPLVVGAWAASVVAVGTGVGAALVVRYRPAVAVRRRARAVESGLPEALSLVGRHIREGTAPEAAVETAGEELSTETGALLTAAAGVQRRLGLTLHEAFVGEFGVLAALPSPRTRAAATVLSVAAVEGRPAGETVVTMAEQLRELERAEAAGRRELEAVSGTLANTAAVFGPLVGGATVALAARIASVETGASLGPALSVPGLGTVLGIYVFVMAATLTALSTGLESGLDGTRIGYRVGIALVLAGVTFVVGVVAAGLLV